MELREGKKSDDVKEKQNILTLVKTVIIPYYCNKIIMIGVRSQSHF